MTNFQTLVWKEKSLRKVEANEKMTMADFLKFIVEPRAEFAREVEAFHDSGQITKRERDELIKINREHGLPPQRYDSQGSALW